MQCSRGWKESSNRVLFTSCSCALKSQVQVLPPKYDQSLQQQTFLLQKTVLSLTTQNKSQLRTILTQTAQVKSDVLRLRLRKRILELEVCFQVRESVENLEAAVMLREIAEVSGESGRTSRVQGVGAGCLRLTPVFKCAGKACTIPTLRAPPGLIARKMFEFSRSNKAFDSFGY